jgi:hypothetical protein
MPYLSRMKIHKIALLALAVMLSMPGCKPKATAAATTTVATTTPTGETASGAKAIATAQAAVSDSPEGRDEFLGQREISGPLYSTKGDQAMIAGVMIDQGFIYEESGRDWKEEFNALRDSQVVAKGDVWRHHCAPGEQCLTQGYIDHLTKVQYLRKAK